MHNEEITIIKVDEPQAGRILTTTIKAYETMYQQQGYVEYDQEFFADADAEDAPFVEVSPPARKLTGAAKAAATRKAKQRA